MDYTKIKRSLTAKEDYNKFLKVIQQSTCDKHGMGFNLDDRFTGGVIELSIDSWKGYYGNSGCTAGFRIDDTFKEYFVKYLNKHFSQIIEETFALMEKDLTDYIDDEIDSQRKRLSALLEERIKLKLTSQKESQKD